MEQIFTTEFWKSELAFVMGAPWIVIPLLLIAGVGGWWLRGREDSGHIRGLQAQLGTRDERLKLADDRYKDLMGKLTVATEEIASLKKLVEQGVAEPAKPAFFKSLQFRVDRTVQAIESANTSSAALGRTLTIGPTLGRTVTEPSKPSTTPKVDDITLP